MAPKAPMLQLRPMVGLVSEPAGPRELDAADTEPGDDHEKAGAGQHGHCCSSCDHGPPATKTAARLAWRPSAQTLVRDGPAVSSSLTRPFLSV